jgi:hypothetical protein
MGAVERRSATDGSSYVTVSQLVEHPDFEDITEEYDFMVLKLGGWVCFIFHLICLGPPCYLNFLTTLLTTKITIRFKRSMLH